MTRRYSHRSKPRSGASFKRTPRCATRRDRIPATADRTRRTANRNEPKKDPKIPSNPHESLLHLLDAVQEPPVLDLSRLLDTPTNKQYECERRWTKNSVCTDIGHSLVHPLLQAWPPWHASVDSLPKLHGVMGQARSSHWLVPVGQRQGTAVHEL